MHSRAAGFRYSACKVSKNPYVASDVWAFQDSSLLVFVLAVAVLVIVLFIVIVIVVFVVGIVVHHCVGVLVLGDVFTSSSFPSFPTQTDANVERCI